MRPKELDCLFESVVIGKMKLKNRIVMAPMGTGFAGDGVVTDRLIDYLTARAKGGAGLITVEVAYIHRLGKAGLGGELGIDDDKYIPGLKKLTDSIHNAGAKVVLQLNHAGRYARAKNLGEQAVAPSPIASRYTGEKPRELSTPEVGEIVEAFAEGARRARDAGFDGVELMGSTGYLISQFCSPITNKRTDKYGGDTPAARSVFVKEIIKKIREKTGDDLSICVKMSVDEYLPGGNTIKESQIMGQEFVKAGADRLHAWAGWHESPKPMLPMSVPRAAFAHLAEALKAVTNVPITTVGRINDPFVAASLIKEGKADLIAIGRGMLSDAEFALKTYEGRTDEIRNCIGCCVCFDTVMSRIHSSGPTGVACGINPELGREGENLLKPVAQGKKVLVVGGGPGGMEAARVASLKGHNVTLWEKSGSLGGALKIASLPPLKEELECLTRYLTTQMKVNNITVELNKNVSSDDVIKENADCTIISTGAIHKVPPLPGIENVDYIFPVDVLTNNAEVGENVVIIGGGLIGIDVAEHLNDQGKNVTLLTRQSKVGADIGASTRWVTMMRIKKSNIKVIKEVSYKEITSKRVLIESKGKEMDIPADTIVLSGGLVPDRELIDSLKGKISLIEVGDCISPRKIDNAIEEGFNAALQI